MSLLALGKSPLNLSLYVLALFLLAEPTYCAVVLHWFDGRIGMIVQRVAGGYVVVMQQLEVLPMVLRQLVHQLSDVLLPHRPVDSLFLDDLAVQHSEYSIRVVLQVYIVRNHYQSNALVQIQVQQDLQNVFGVLRVQISCGFVQQQHFGLIGEGSGYSHSLLLPS